MEKRILQPYLHGDTVYVEREYGSLFALEAPTGKIRWWVDTRATLAEPVFSDGKVYTVGRLGLFAIDEHTGNVLWHVAETNQRNRFRAGPSVANNMVLWPHDDAFYAYDALTGNVVWKLALSIVPKHGYGISEPAIVIGECAYVLEHRPGSSLLYAVSIENGLLRWQTSLDEIYPRLTVVNGQLFTSLNGLIQVDLETGKVQKLVNHLPINGTTYRFEPEGLYHDTLLAIEESTNQKRWIFQHPALSDVLALENGIVYITATSTGPFYTLLALNETSGENRWRADWLYNGYLRPVLLTNTVYVTKILSTTEKDSRCILVALDVSTGNTKWTFTVPESFTGDAIKVGGGCLYIVDINANKLVVLDELTGHVRWDFLLRESQAGSV